MTIYIDSDYKCHLSDGGIRRVVETDFFIGRYYELIYKYNLNKRRIYDYIH